MSEHDDRDWLNIKQAIDQLPDSFEPQQDQWKAICSRIEAEAPEIKVNNIQRSARQGWMPYAVAASLLLAVVSTAISWKSMSAYQALQQQQFALFEQQRSMQLMEDQHQLLKARFLDDFEQQAESMDPAVVADVKNNLVIIEQALADIKKALAQDPGNQRLNELLAETYTQERQLIEQIKLSYPTI